MQESSKSIQIEAFHVFKVQNLMAPHYEFINFDGSFSRLKLLVKIFQLFAANQNKPPDIISILVANRSKLLRLFADFKTEKGRCHLHQKFRNSWLGIVLTILACFVTEDEQFEADKAQVMKEISSLEPRERP